MNHGLHRRKQCTSERVIERANERLSAYNEQHAKQICHAL